MSVKARTEKNFRRAKVKPAKKRTAARVGWRAVLTAALVVLCTFALYRATGLVLSAAVLQVQRITVTGNVRLSSGEVQALVEGLRGSNILAADLAGYRERLMESPWVAEAALRRVLPSTIEVFVSERRPIGLCRIGTQLYLVDGTGRIIDEFSPQYSEFDLPIIDGIVQSRAKSEPAIDERRTGLAADLLEAVAERPALAARISQIDVHNVHDAVVLLDGDPALLHLGTERFAERLQGYIDLAPTLRERVPDMDYVDLRFDGRIYVRPAGSAAMQVVKRPPVRN